MKLQKVIYPEIDIEIEYEGDDTVYVFSTYTRKLHEGKYYLNLIKRSYKTIWSNTYDPISIIKEFHREVYMFQMLGIVSLDILDYKGEKVFELDSDQTDEIERLKNKYIPKRKNNAE
jgi:hypothetical protein